MKTIAGLLSSISYDVQFQATEDNINARAVDGAQLVDTKSIKRPSIPSFDYPIDFKFPAKQMKKILKGAAFITDQVNFILEDGDFIIQAWEDEDEIKMTTPIDELSEVNEHGFKATQKYESCYVYLKHATECERYLDVKKIREGTEFMIFERLDGTKVTIHKTNIRGIVIA